ncbi:MAG: ABC transporter ATP-binding protein [Leptolyngbya sp. DLM2.Bin15]|nr:MAG: ABC transporter ATP-binding protein [Leptolyngbya sp. DLM2.Bin15]
MSIDIQNVSGGYGQASIVQAVSLSLQQEEWLSIVGANGSGKSTLLKLISRILSPQEGAILLDGVDIHHLAPRVVARKMAILPQHQVIPRGITVQQLVSLGRSPYQRWWQWGMTPDDRYHVRHALEQTGLQDFSDRPVESLSGGERQRAFLALALAQCPKVLLLDEPTTYLDIHYQLQLLDLLKSLNRRGLAIMTVLHDINLAARYSDRMAMVRHGRIHALGSPTEVMNPANFAAVFEIDVAIADTPVGRQVFPLSCVSQAPSQAMTC